MIATDAPTVLGLFVALAVVAPRSGFDSTDGVDSPEYRRRAAWWAARAREVTGRGATTGQSRHRAMPRPASRAAATPCGMALVSKASSS